MHLFATRGASPELCIGAAQDADDCESVQFISGMALDADDDAQLVLSYGVNDCEAKLARLPMAAVWRMPRPLAGETGNI